MSTEKQKRLEDQNMLATRFKEAREQAHLIAGITGMPYSLPRVAELALPQERRLWLPRDFYHPSSRILSHGCLESSSEKEVLKHNHPTDTPGFTASNGTGSGGPGAFGSLAFFDHAATAQRGWPAHAPIYPPPYWENQVSYVGAEVPGGSSLLRGEFVTQLDLGLDPTSLASQGIDPVHLSVRLKVRSRVTIGVTGFTLSPDAEWELVASHAVSIRGVAGAEVKAEVWRMEATASGSSTTASLQNFIWGGDSGLLLDRRVAYPTDGKIGIVERGEYALTVTKGFALIWGPWKIVQGQYVEYGGLHALFKPLCWSVEL